MEKIFSNARAYLEKTQKEDGSWGSGDPYVCARVLYALRETGGKGGILKKGVEYIETRQADDGHIKGKTKMYTDASNTAYSLIVLNKFDYSKASNLVNRGIIWLLEDQNPDGSWNGSNKNKKGYTTTTCLRALHTFYLTGISRYKKGIEFAREYVKTLNFYDEPVSHVYAPVLNLKRIGQLDAEVHDKFVRYADTAFASAVDGGMIVDVAYLLGTLKALEETGISAIAEEWIPATQNADGGFGKDINSPSDPNWTALVVLAMKDRL